MTPEEYEERIARTVAAAPPLAPEVLAELRQLLPPVAPAAQVVEAPRLELAA